MTEIINIIIGPIAAVLGGVMLIVVAWLNGRARGKSSVERKLDKAYRDTRKEIDNADLGLGATDAQRIDRLHDIAGKR